MIILCGYHMTMKVLNVIEQALTCGSAQYGFIEAAPELRLSPRFSCPISKVMVSPI